MNENVVVTFEALVDMGADDSHGHILQARAVIDQRGSALLQGIAQQSTKQAAQPGRFLFQMAVGSPQSSKSGDEPCMVGLRDAMFRESAAQSVRSASEFEHSALGIYELTHRSEQLPSPVELAISRQRERNKAALSRLVSLSETRPFRSLSNTRAASSLLPFIVEI